MSVDLDPALVERIEAKVRAGDYASMQDAVNVLLSFALDADDQPSDAELEHLRGAIAEGIAQADRGEFVEWDEDEISAEVERRHAQEQGKKAG